MVLEGNNFVDAGGFDTGIRPWYREKNELVWASTWSNRVSEYERHTY